MFPVNEKMLTPVPRLLCRTIFLMSYLSMQGFFSIAQATHKIDFTTERATHKLKTLSKQKYARIAELSDMHVFKKQILNPMLIERVSDSVGNLDTQEHIKYWMGDKFGWHIDEDSFQNDTPFKVKNFKNIIATLDPSARRFLTLACHFDSKYFKEFKFIGATDSAVPCAMLIDLARTLNYSLHYGKDSYTDGVSLQFVFFDGEEAFVEWSEKDSIYGARHLAEKWEKTPHPHDGSHTVLHGMDALVLLDLIGTKRPRFRSFFKDTDRLFKRLQDIELRLHKAEVFDEHHSKNEYFVSYQPYGGIEDDHIPFLRRGVPILHLIPTPFPDVWHTAADDESALHYPTINNINKILRVFVAEYLHLKI